MAVRLRGDYCEIDYYFEGKRIKKVLKTSKIKEAKRYLAEIQHRILMGEYSVDFEITLEEAINKFLDNKRIDEIANKTYKGYKDSLDHFKKFVKERLMISKLRHIKKEHIEKFREFRKYLTFTRYQAKQIELTSPATVNVDLRYLRAFFNYCAENQLVAKSPFKKIKFCEIPQIKPRMLPDDQVDLILNTARDKYKNTSFYCLLLAYIFTGTRLGELINLDWNNVNIKKMYITIESTAGYKTKNRKTRDMPLHPVLWEEMVKLGKKDDKGLVFKNANKEKYSNFYNKFRRFVKTLGFDDLKPHDFRHSFASHLSDKLVSQKVIKDLMGHSSIQVTERYEHTLPFEKIDAISRLPNWGQKNND